MSQLPVPGVRNVLGGLIGPYEKRKKHGWMALGGGVPPRKGRVASLLGAGALSFAAAVALLLGGLTGPAHSLSFDAPSFDVFAVDRTAPLTLAALGPQADVSHRPSLNAVAAPVEKPSAVESADDNLMPDIGFNEWINVMAVLAVIWIALRTERLRRQSDDTGRFRRLHERMDDHSRRLAAHETRLQGLPTHKDLARIDARLVAVEHTMQQIAHSVTRMEDFLINGAAAAVAATEMPHDA